MAEVFRAAGYRTVSFYTNRIVGHMQGLNRGFSSLHDYSTRFQGQPARVGDLPDSVLPWISAHLDEPMFVYVHTLEPHHPYIPQGRFAVASDYVGHIDSETFREARTPAELAHVLTLYDSEIQYMDHSLGLLVGHLRKSGLFDESLLVFTSDHGEQFLEHGGWLHSKGLYDHQVHVPLIVHLPGGAGAGRRETRIVRSIDILPTMLSALGLPALPRAEGVDLFGADDLQPVFARSEQTRTDGTSFVSIRSERWKAVRVETPEGEVTTELFDLAADPREQAPLALETGTALPAGSQAVVAALDLKPAPVRVDSGTEEEGDLDTRDLDQLRELGYIE